MKKIISVLLAASMVLSMAACGKKDDNQETQGTQGTAAETMGETLVDNTDWMDETVELIGGDNNQGGETITVQYYVDAFNTVMNQGEAKTPIEIVTKMNEIAPSAFFAALDEMEAGWMPGFTEDVTGFEQAATLAPMMTGIAFVSYVFQLAEDVDAAAYAENLKTIADMRWQVCVEAEVMETVVVGQTVFFIMCPAQMQV